MGWSFVGTKKDFADIITTTTRIPKGAIIGDRPISSYSIASRMSWSSRRRTTREEDRAYSLLGLFGIAMPLIYAEGDGAFRRLQKKLVKNFSDMTIFAWNSPPCRVSPFLGAFASSPDWFAEAPDGIPSSGLTELVEFSISNRGILLSQSPPIYRISKKETHLTMYALFVGCLAVEQAGGDTCTETVAVIVRKIGHNLFCRDARHGIQVLSARLGAHREFLDEPLAAENARDICLFATPAGVERMLANSRLAQLRVLQATDTEDNSRDFTLTHICPLSLWDTEDKVILRPPNLPMPNWGVPACLQFPVRVRDHTRNIGFPLIVTVGWFGTAKHRTCKLFVLDGKYQRRGVSISFDSLVEPLTVCQLFKALPGFDQLIDRVIVPCGGGSTVSITAELESSRLELAAERTCKFVSRICFSRQRLHD